MDISLFVDRGEIDPIYFAKTYYLGPGNDETKNTYALLRDAMADAGKTAIASFVMRSKEYLGAVRADGDLLVLETMFFADEVRDPHEQIDNLPGRVRHSQRELRVAAQLIDAMSGPWEPSEYRDTYTDRVNELIDAKKNDKEFTPAPEAPAATEATSLMEALRASLDAVQKSPGSRSAKNTTARQRAATSRSARATKQNERSSGRAQRSSARNGKSSGRDGKSSGRDGKPRGRNDKPAGTTQKSSRRSASGKRASAG
jgi:DNA end-binding protein Ku